MALGFLTVIEHPQYGLFGGYLVLNVAGRPLEFHCTAPVKPNRAQEILYGATLEPYLFGEQIGQTLVSKSKLDPLVICTDREPALALREYIETPVALILSGEEPLDENGGPRGGEASATRDPAQSSAPQWRLDHPHPCGRWTAFTLGRNRLAVPAAASDDRQRITERLEGLADSLDLAEPFRRIREAIEEARKGGQ